MFLLFFFVKEINCLNLARRGGRQPAPESCTGTRLVSPAAGCKKKKKTPLEHDMKSG